MSKAADNRKLTLKLLGFALGSFAFGFALVPLYDVLCDLTGFGNQKAIAEARAAVEQPDDSRQPLAVVAVAGPHVPQPRRQSQSRLDALAIARCPVQRGAEVAELRPKLIPLGVEAHVIELRGQRAGQVEVVAQVPAAGVSRVTAGVEQLAGVLADRLEQAVPGVLRGELDRDERRAHELVEHVVASSSANGAHGGKRLGTAGDHERQHHAPARHGRPLDHLRDGAVTLVGHRAQLRRAAALEMEDMGRVVMRKLARENSPNRVGTVQGFS